MAKKTAEEFAKEQKEISVSQFFEKNKHLLGFDNPTKALLMAVKEAVDNALDAAEEAGILPDINVKIKQNKEDVYTISVQDNGPGIVKENVGRVFGKLLYGSKFHRLMQNRGQQGIGISSVTMYSQLTTGSAMRIWSRPESSKKTYYTEIHVDTAKNEPEIVREEMLEDGPIKEHGIKIEVDVAGRYRKTVEDYLKYTSISNPFAKISYQAPDGTKITFPRSVNELPKPPKKMMPHPYGMEFGILQRMLKATASRSLSSFLTNEFSSIGSTTAAEMCKISKLPPSTKPGDLGRDEIEKLLAAMQKVKVQRPPTDCLSPIGENDLEKSLKKEYPEAELVVAIKRDPDVYRGFPFLVEVGIVYGGPDMKQDNAAELIRFANRVPLLYQQGACAITESVKEVDWKRYGLSQSNGSMPTGPVRLVVHVCSVWVPFVSESKEAVAPYPEIIKEVKLAVQDAGRQMYKYLSGKRRLGEAKRRLQIFERYSVEVAHALSILTGKNEKELERQLKELVTKKLPSMDEDANDGSKEKA